MMVLGSVKGHEVWRISKMRWSPLSKGEKLAGSEGMGVLLLDGLGGVMSEKNLGRGGFGIFGAVWGMLGKEVVG